MDAICIFVHDTADTAIIEQMAGYGVKLIALRAAGYNNVDLAAAKDKLKVVRVPAYSPNTGNKKQTISVTASKNISSERNTVLSISAKGITKTININQKKGISVAVIVGQNGNIFKIQLE